MADLGEMLSSQGIQLRRESTEVLFYPQLLFLFCVPPQQRVHEREKKIGVWDSSLP